ncbi:FAD binding domain-containing protein [Tengunoibacter tsumagoiensis]|uniref:Carbon monoxide dehydrogenase n=1 Tax=Tengunoibacter tsumagoiensis TaxID=2014871 RepID=A0A402A0C5_9CHLR|nr:xanthine dehydrogenase family protein subunit M [Tengunoibacter tsumagoiensis]GCE12607.1 carbon monoxide dehydrogenase [Tengunoibacter tsumagoiensis]
MSVPAAFDYHSATSVAEAIALLQQYGDEAKILAGGHSLIPAMKLRLSQPEHLIDIGRITELSYIRQEGQSILLGAMTTYAQIERAELIKQHFPLLIDGVSVIGDQQVRNRGTVAGSIAHSDPAADMPGIILALKAEIILQGPDGIRTVAADDFFLGTFTTALEPDELITAIKLPLLPAQTGSAYTKLENKASHYAIAGSAAIVTLDNTRTCTAASLTITGAALQTSRATSVEAALIGKKLDPTLIQQAAEKAPDGLEFLSDIHGSQEYRRQMTIVMVRRAIQQAYERA